MSMCECVCVCGCLGVCLSESELYVVCGNILMGCQKRLILVLRVCVCGKDFLVIRDT